MKEKQRRVLHHCACRACQAHPYGAQAKEHRAINRVLTTLDEKRRRQLVGLLAMQWGRGAVELLRQITGLSRPTIRQGRHEVSQGEGRKASQARVRQRGGGRHSTEKKSPR
jgi:hypothetical protein